MCRLKIWFFFFFPASALGEIVSSGNCERAEDDSHIGKQLSAAGGFLPLTTCQHYEGRARPRRPAEEIVTNSGNLINTLNQLVFFFSPGCFHKSPPSLPSSDPWMPGNRPPSPPLLQAAGYPRADVKSGASEAAVYGSSLSMCYIRRKSIFWLQIKMAPTPTGETSNAPSSSADSKLLDSPLTTNWVIRICICGYVGLFSFSCGFLCTQKCARNRVTWIRQQREN